MMPRGCRHRCVVVGPRYTRSQQNARPERAPSASAGYLLGGVGGRPYQTLQNPPAILIGGVPIGASRVPPSPTVGDAGAQVPR